MQLQQTGFVKGRYEQQTVYRAARLAQDAPAILADFNPDAVIVQAMAAMPVAHAVSAAGWPLVVYWHDAERRRMNGVPDGLDALYLANSRFTARFYGDAFGVESTVVPPLIRRERYLAPSHTRERVTFVGLAPEKGLDVALEVARRCPDIPFDFVESWMLRGARRRELLKRLAALPNVSFVPHQPSMLGVYARSRILLAPSQWQEAWGRVASEAHINGIPVVGSAIGGLVESIGPGGVLLEPDAPPEEWAGHVRTLWFDQSRWERLSSAASAYAERPDLDPAVALARILEVVQAAIEMKRTGAASAHPAGPAALPARAEPP